MNDMSEQFHRVWENIKGQSASVVRSIEIPADKVADSGAFASKFEPGKQYFSVIVNEMFATNSRRWFDLYDPAAFVVSEFVYDGRKVVVPFVVGPAMLEGKAAITPDGVSITDTKVAGVHPFMGGNFAITIVVAEVKRSSYAKKLLEFASDVSSAFPIGGALSSHLKIAGTLLDSVENLLGLTDTKPMAAHRFEYNHGQTAWLKPGFFALLAEDEKIGLERKLSVSKGRLQYCKNEATKGFRESDFVLYSLCTQNMRSDITELPFYRLFNSALRDAGAADVGAWDRAKAALVTIYQELLTSPDLTWEQVHVVIEEFKSKLVQAHDTRQRFIQLGGSDATNASSIDAGSRSAEILEAHKLLQI